MEAPIDLNLLRAFAEVHARGSFSAAAQQLGVPRSTVSRAIGALESQIGQPLFQRTTRKVSTTRAGNSLYERVAPAIAALQSSLLDLADAEAEPSGVLRLTATADLGAVVLSEAIARYTLRFPKVQVEAHLTNQMVDLVQEGFDLALRIARESLASSSLVARKVGSVTFQIYASPAYLARRGLPRHPEELSSHDWVALRGAPVGLDAARLGRRSARPQVRVTGDDVFFVREALRHGCGLGAIPSFMGDAEVVAGALVRVLPAYQAFRGNVFLAHPATKHLPARVSAFREILVELLRQRPLHARS